MWASPPTKLDVSLLSKIGFGPPPRVMDFKTINAAGIPLDIYGLDDIKSDRVAVLFVHHGRCINRTWMTHFSEAILTNSRKEDNQRDLVIVNFDQRNHGERTVNQDNNWGIKGQGFDTGNNTHPLDMFAIYSGTARDVSFLVDFLPAFLFPKGDKKIEEFMVTGFSLGGHATWMTLRHEPRVKIGIPIVGCPNFKSLMDERLTAQGFEYKAPLIPDSLQAIVDKTDAVSCDFEAEGEQTNPYWGKKILVLSGKKDTMVPHVPHTSTFLEKLNVGPDGRKESEAFDCGHELIEEMIERSTEWIRVYGLLGAEKKEN